MACVYVEMSYDVHVLCLEASKDMALDARVQNHIVPYNEALRGTETEQMTAYHLVAACIDDYVIENRGTPDLILANIYKIN